ncbi:hypothetical protein F1654_01355 [Alkalicaulis satelles]|uniref:Uncharacterized protein n=1 Tax=Alkalicaulis satelles TaxID=2609175 RepID=A0A5M6ZK11_9PROT|nr:hypothetical protein [Alkalicaulis satelles]KAA5804680.1 hypothetical protein F1654_01355 [Alkalicaulis satelles]
MPNMSEIHAPAPASSAGPAAAFTGWAVRTGLTLMAIPATTLVLFLWLENDNPGVLKALFKAGNWVSNVILNSPLGAGDAARLTLYLSGAPVMFMLLMLASTVLVLGAMALIRAVTGALAR